jgi:hypothetical protein
MYLNSYRKECKRVRQLGFIKHRTNMMLLEKRFNIQAPKRTGKWGRKGLLWDGMERTSDS